MPRRKQGGRGPGGGTEQEAKQELFGSVNRSSKTNDNIEEGDTTDVEGGNTEESSKSNDEKFTIYVQCKDDRIGEVETFGSQTIRALKFAIENDYGRACIYNKLINDEGMELKDDKRVADYGITENTLISSQMQIYVGFLKKKGFLLDVQPDTSIGEVKIMIESTDSECSMTNQRIFLEGTNLENQMSLSRCGVTDNANLFVLVRDDGQESPKKNGAFHVYAKSDDKILTLEVTPTDTIAVVKSQIWAKEHITPDCQRLSFCGSYLEEQGKNIWDCGITSESLLYLVTSQNPESGNVAQSQYAEPEVMDSNGRAQGSGETNGNDDNVTILFMNNFDTHPLAVNKNTKLSEAFQEYSRTIHTSVSDLQFTYGEYGELPSDCDFTPDMLAISDGDIIAVHNTAPSSFFSPQVMQGNSPYGHTTSDIDVMDLTLYSTGTTSTGNHIVITLRGKGGDSRFKIDSGGTSLQLLFSTFADEKDVDPSSLLYMCGSRRLSREAEETASQYGIKDKDIIRVVMARKEPSQANPIARGGKIAINVLEIGNTERDFFMADASQRVGKVLEGFAQRKGLELSKLRFFYNDKVLYADTGDMTTPTQLLIREGDVIYAVIKNPPDWSTTLPLTTNSVKTIHQQMRPGQIFEPAVQIIALRRSPMMMTISDGKHQLCVHVHPRLGSLLDSEELERYTIIWALDIKVVMGSNGLKRFTLMDAELAGHGERVIGSPSCTLTSSTASETGPISTPIPSSPAAKTRRDARLKKGLPWLKICSNEQCSSVSENLSQCSRCKFFGYCSRDCQAGSWKEQHKRECRYYEAYYEFIKDAEDEDEEIDISDIFSFWTEQQAKLSKPFTRDLAASICNSSLYCAYGLVTNDYCPIMAQAYILNAAFLRQCCITPNTSLPHQGPGTSIEDMVERYDFGSQGVALRRFLSHVPYLKAGYDAIISKPSMLAYLDAQHAYDELIVVGSPVLEGEVMLQVSMWGGPSSPLHCGLSQDIGSILQSFVSRRGSFQVEESDLRVTFEQKDGTTVPISTQIRTKPSELGMESRGKYSINISAYGAKEHHAQEVIANFVTKRIQLRKVREIVARNVIVDVVWRYRERKARKVIGDFVWYCHQQRKARKTIGNLLWRRIAFRKRQALRDNATVIQRSYRGHSTRNVYLEPLQQRLEQLRRFSAIWKHTIDKVPTAPTALDTLSGWAQVRERIDLKKVELMDEEGNLQAETDDKLSNALTSALAENSGGSIEDELEDDLEDEHNNFTSDETNTNMYENLANMDWSQFQVTAHVVKWMKQGDAKYREIFVKKMKQLARGERSHKLQKPLAGCKSVVYETYLENKSGFRILWTQESDTLVVWFIAKHKSVSRLAKLIDDAKNRTARQNLSDNLISELENGDSSTKVTKKREVLLDALGNVPLKLYDVTFDNIDSIESDSWAPQMHLTDEERKVVEAKGTVLLLGRSGTGKTVCICNRLEYDRQRLGHKPDFSQLFVSRSSRLCGYVEAAVGKHTGSTFTTFDRLIRSLESSLPNERQKVYHNRHHVDFARFRREFYSERFPQEKISALIAWKAIRTFLKGSMEAFQSPTGQLSRDYFVTGKLGKNRCKIPELMRETIYGILLQYELWMRDQHLWDDCDRISALLKGIEDVRRTTPSLYDEKIKRSKLYVDEVQDYLQTEILLFFYIGGGPGALFLAGDPAQSVVEGTDFRFEEVRSVGYYIAGNERRHLIPEKPKIVNINFRSHAGILNAAGGFLDLLFEYFPGSAKQLKKDRGLFKGARPGVFHSVKEEQLATLLQEKMQGAVILTHDETASQWKERLGHHLVYGIREAKGLEFKSVIIVDFFAELPSSLQKPWRNLLKKREGSDFESRYPLVETHLKLVYTGITRCIEQLFFAETKSSIAGDAAMQWLTTPSTNSEEGKVDQFATRNNVEDIEGMVMTSDEFCIVGIDNADLASSSDLDPMQAASYLDRSIYCFEKAQRTELVAKAQAHLDSIKMRQKILQNHGSSMTTDEKDAEEEVAHVLTLLLEEQLYSECMNLLGSITPIVSPYTQQKLEETIISPIEVAM